MEEQFKYECSIFGTFANPLDIEHLNVIYKSASASKKLFIILFNYVDDNINYKKRYQWIYNQTSHLPNVTIIPQKIENDKFYLNSLEIDSLKELNNLNVFYIFDEELDKFCDFRTELDTINEDFELKILNKNILSEEINLNPFKHWDSISKVAKEEFVKKVLIIGNESTGKSIMARNLANIYNTICVDEYSRDVCMNCGGEDYMLNEDFEEILYQHKLNIVNASKIANKLLFIDTDAFMSVYYRNQCKINNNSILDDEKIIQKISRDYDLVLFMESDVPYVQDDLRIIDRNIDGYREECTNKIKDLYARNGIQYEIISGNYSERLEKAQNLINEKFDLR